MPNLRVLAAFALLAALPLGAQEQRIASDFEIAQMQRQLERSPGFEARLGARLNLGDARAARNERSLARAEYEKALDLAQKERLAARAASSLSRYANATSWAALAFAKLGRADEAFDLLEETARYASDDPETWNLYSSAMRVAGKPEKAVSAARNAVEIAGRTAGKDLDLQVYRYALATALLDARRTPEAEALLEGITTALRSPTFDALRREAAKLESFEVNSSARGDVAAWVSLLNRAQLRLAALYEQRGEAARARAEYERVLQGRSDDEAALSALARLAESDADRERYYAAAFDANPFSLRLIRDYRSSLAGRNAAITGNSIGARMREVAGQLERGDHRAARASLDAMLEKYPDNETLRTLRAEAEATHAVAVPDAEPSSEQLLSLLDGFERLAPAQRIALDTATYTGEVRFDPLEQKGDPGVSVFAAGTIAGVPFRFGVPTAFRGEFSAGEPLALTYRILGVTRAGDRDALLLEPVRLERGR